MTKRELARQKRHTHLRTKVVGTAERPRLSVYKSLKGLQVQIIDDTTGKTVLSGSSHAKYMQAGSGIERAQKLGQALAKQAAAKKLKTFVFDRGGFRYHGQVKALAETLRAEGLTI